MDPSIVIFAIESAVKLGSKVYEVLVDETAERALVLPVGNLFQEVQVTVATQFFLRTENRHLIDTGTRRLQCACEPCTLLFAHRGQTTLRGVGRHVRWLDDFQLDDAEWDALRIPIGLAFFVHNSQQGRMTALYPGPAGPTESLLALEAWDHIASRNPVLRELEPDVEALLVNRVGAARKYCLAPVDRCYELAGLIRMHWRGFSGGDEVWREIGDFFSRLRKASHA